MDQRDLKACEVRNYLLRLNLPPVQPGPDLTSHDRSVAMLTSGCLTVYAGPLNAADSTTYV